MDVSYQCVEMADRFLRDAWGESPISGASLTGATFVRTAGADDHLPVVANGTPRQPYLPGDIVSLTDGCAGDTANP